MGRARNWAIGDNGRHTFRESPGEFDEAPILLKRTYVEQFHNGENPTLVTEALSADAKLSRALEKRRGACFRARTVQLRNSTRLGAVTQMGRFDHSPSRLLSADVWSGRTVPATARHAFSVRAEALSPDWPIPFNVARPSPIAESNDNPKQALATSLKPGALPGAEPLPTGYRRRGNAIFADAIPYWPLSV